MSDIINYCIEYKWYIVALVVFAIAFVIVVKKTSVAYKRYYSNYRSEEQRMKRLVDLKNRFSDLTAEVIQNENEEELLEGVALCYQLKLQKLDNMEEEFAKYNIEKRYIYALDVLTQSESLSAFFKENGEELTDIIIPAIEYIELDTDYKRLKKLRTMFDEKDETTSVSQTFIDEMDKFALDTDIFGEIKKKGASKIKIDAEKFLFNKI